MSEEYIKKFKELLKTGNYKQAMDVLEQALKHNPKDIDALNLKCGVLIQNKQFKEALDATNKYLEINPNEENALKLKVIILETLGKYQEELDVLNILMNIIPGDAITLQHKGFAFFHLRRCEEAIEALNKSIDINPNIAHTWQIKGRALGGLGKHQEAVDTFNKALEIDPNNAQSSMYKGNALIGLKKYEEAIDAISESLDINPRDANIWRLKGYALGALGKNQDALDAISKSLEINPDDAVSLKFKAKLLEKFGKLGESLDAINKSVTINPNDQEAWQIKGKTLQILKQTEEALVALNKALDIDPHNAETSMYKAAVLLELRKYEEALYAINKSISVNPNNANAWQIKGHALDSLGKYQEALDAVDKSIEINGDNVFALNLKVILLEKLGEDEKDVDVPNKLLNMKNALCDRLMKEGIEGRQNEDAITRADLLAELAIDLGRQDCLKCVLAWFEALEHRSIDNELAAILDYSRANAIGGNRYGTKWQWEQSTLAREIFYLRRAVSHPKFNQVPDINRCQILNNLGNRMKVAGRVIESLEYWRRALEIMPNFGMALCNRAIHFADYAQALEDEGYRALFFLVAYKEASAALASTALYTHPHDRHNQKETKTLKERIESVIDVERAAALEPFTCPNTSIPKNEYDYRHWSLTNRLYLNPLNDLGVYTIANTDSLVLPSHVVPVDASHTFESFFDQMKQEYVSARWMLYEGLTMKVPHFSDKDVPLNMTEPRPTLSLAIERVKAAYRISYSLFDKIGFFLNSYMDLGIPERQISFRGLWRSEDKTQIRKEFDQTGNWGFCALYWLAKDFFEKEADEVAEPEARGLSDIRNCLEHKYLRITVDEPAASPLGDLALMVSREQFEAKALHILGLARSALIYLSIGIGFEESRREPGRNGVPIEKLPPTPDLPDDEKI